MPYFERTDSETYARRFGNAEAGNEGDEAYDAYDDGYGDGFDELMEDPGAEEPLDPEEERLLAEEKKLSRLRKLRIAAGLGDFGAVLVGVAVILLLVAFLISMLRFVSNDFNRTFSLWQVRF